MDKTINKISIFAVVLISIFLLFTISNNIALAVSSTDLTDTQDTAVSTNMELFGSYTWDIAVDPTNTDNIYLATYYSPNGWFWSNDGGDTWTGLPVSADHGAGHDVEVNPDNGDVYVLMNDLLKSTDNGGSYEVLAELGSGAGTMLYARETLFVTSNDDVIISDDDGITFETVTICEGETIWSIAASGNDGNVFALCYDYGSEESTLYKSTNVGATWTDLDIAADGVTSAEQIVINPTNDYLFTVPSSLGGSTYSSDDDGLNWHELPEVPNSGHLTFDIAGNIYSGWHMSADNGVTWEDFGSTGDYNHIIFPDPVNANTFYDSSVPGFSISTDGGATWTDSVEGITGVDVTSISQATDKNNVWVATQNGPALTSNFTADNPDWVYKSIGDNYTSSGYDSIWVKPDDSNIVVTSSSQDLLYSADGGDTWTSATVDVSLTGAVFQIVNDDDGTLYAAFGPNTSAGEQTGGVIKSTDDGVNWTSLDFPSNNATRSITIAADGDLFVGAHSSAGGIYKFDGSSWTQVLANDYEYRAVIADPESADTVYALASDDTSNTNVGFFKSTDDGATWTQSNTGIGSLNDIQTFNTLALQESTSPNTLYLSAVQSGTSFGLIYKSSNGGDTWDLYYVGKTSEVFKTLLFDGLVAGSNVGLHDMKSRATLKVKSNKNKVTRNKKVNITFTLKDSATAKKLIRKKVKVYKKIANKKKKFWKKVTLNKNGKKVIKATVKNKTVFSAKWTPNSTDRNEYAVATSNTKRIKLKK